MSQLTTLHAAVGRDCKDLCSNSKLKYIRAKDFATRKDYLLQVEALLDASPDMPLDAQQDLLAQTLESRSRPSAQQQNRSVMGKLYSSAASFVPGNMFNNDAKNPPPQTVSDQDFLAMVPSMTERFPVLVEAAAEAVTMARQHFSTHISKEVHRVVRSIEDRRRSECKKPLKAQSERNLKRTRDETRSSFFHSIRDHFLRDKDR